MNIDGIIARIAPLAPLALAMAGCTAVDAGFGDTVKRNIAVQTVDPAPAYADAHMSARGDKTGPAIERYRSDRVKRPRGIKTTSAGGGSGASGGSGGSGQ